MTSQANTPTPQGESKMLAALDRLAPKLADGATRVRDLARMSGGATQEIWRFDVVGEDDGKVHAKVLRRAPMATLPGGPGIGLALEARLMEAGRAAGVPVPRVDWVLTPEDELGEGFVMDFIEGETLGGRIVRSEQFTTARQTLARDCGTILARIHLIDASEFPTLPFDEPVALVRRWREAYLAGEVVRPVFELAFAWLVENAPPAPERPSLVHGDFRNGNLMIGVEGIRAVLDWELAHVGDPMEDLGWICVNSWRFGRMDRPVGGFGSHDDLLSGYEQGSGTKLNRDTIRWWEAFGTMRWGVMCAGGLMNYRSGDPSVERAMIARRASETEIDLLRLMSE
jgi:aminoglycoside phosphotransferase (APT) family kinase protein